MKKYFREVQLKRIHRLIAIDVAMAVIAVGAIAAEPIKVLDGHAEPVTMLQFGPDGETLAAYASDGSSGLMILNGNPPDVQDDAEVRLWDLQTGKPRYGS